MHRKSALSPYTGKKSRGDLPGHGIGKWLEPAYVRYMDSWDALRRNLTALLEAAGDGLISGPSGVLQLEAATDIGKSTLYRILDPRTKNPTQLDTLERIAKAYNLQVWQLLVPRLDPLDPPAVIGTQRMAVLRSVFQQTTAAAQQQPHGPNPSAPDSPTGSSPGEAGNRVHPEREPTAAVPAGKHHDPALGRRKAGRPKKH